MMKKKSDHSPKHLSSVMKRKIDKVCLISMNERQSVHLIKHVKIIMYNTVSLAVVSHIDNQMNALYISQLKSNNYN